MRSESLVAMCSELGFQYPKNESPYLFKLSCVYTKIHRGRKSPQTNKIKTTLLYAQHNFQVFVWRMSLLIYCINCNAKPLADD